MKIIDVEMKDRTLKELLDPSSSIPIPFEIIEE